MQTNHETHCAGTAKKIGVILLCVRICDFKRINKQHTYTHKQPGRLVLLSGSTRSQNGGVGNSPPVASAAHPADEVVKRQPVEGGAYSVVKYRAPASINHKLTHKTRLGRYTRFVCLLRVKALPPPPIATRRAHLHIHFLHNS